MQTINRSLYKTFIKYYIQYNNIIISLALTTLWNWLPVHVKSLTDEKWLPLPGFCLNMLARRVSTGWCPASAAILHLVLKYIYFNIIKIILFFPRDVQDRTDNIKAESFYNLKAAQPKPKTPGTKANVWLFQGFLVSRSNSIIRRNLAVKFQGTKKTSV